MDVQDNDARKILKRVKVSGKVVVYIDHSVIAYIIVNTEPSEQVHQRKREDHSKENRSYELAIFFSMPA